MLFPQISPSVVEATCIKNIKPSLENHCKKELRKASKDQILLRNEDYVGMLKPNLIIHKTNERKSSEAPMKPVKTETKSPVIPAKKIAKAASQTVRVTSQNLKSTHQTMKVSSQAAKPVKIQAIARVQTVAQMPRDVRTASQQISSLFQPL